jgi:hypothetical protein
MSFQNELVLAAKTMVSFSHSEVDDHNTDTLLKKVDFDLQ